MLPSRDWVNEVPRMITTQEPESLYLDYKESRGLALDNRVGQTTSTEWCSQTDPVTLSLTVAA